MSNNAPDYENDLVFPPQEIKSQDDLSEQGRQSDVLIKAIEKCEKLEKENQQLKAIKEKTYNYDYLSECYSKFIKENQQLKAQIAKLTEIVGVLPSNHSVGNLGYKIKNQRHEINNRLKEIDKLKELLKECLNEIHELAEIQDNRSVTIYNFLSAELITKIDNVIGEKK